MKPGKSWREKLADSKGLPKVGQIAGKMTRRWEGHKILKRGQRYFVAGFEKSLAFVRS